MSGDPRAMVGAVPDPRTGPEKCRAALEEARTRTTTRPNRTPPTEPPRPTACAHPYVEAAAGQYVCTRCGTVTGPVPPPDEPSNFDDPPPPPTEHDEGTQP